MTENQHAANRLCPECGKRITTSTRAGSLTSYIFQPFNCNCAIKGSKVEASKNAGGGQGISRSRASAGPDGDYTFCPNCGLPKPSQSIAGSITGFMFKDTRCKCPSKAAVSNDMAEKFWRLKEADSGTTFVTGGGKSSGGANRKAISIDLKPGAVIGGAYRIEKLIGVGGMGEIYLALHLPLDKLCAIKMIPPDQVTDSGWQRFQKEAKSVASLDHINLVKVTDLGIHEGCMPYYAMEYVEGQNLAEMIEKNGPLPLPLVLNTFIQICDGVDYAHRKGLIHRDLKPANIMLAQSQTDKLLIKILDFGLVKLTRQDRHEQSQTSVGEIFGSPFYMSPEQCLGEKVDNRSDIYSLGCTMFHCLTGRPPFNANLAVAVLSSHCSADPPTLESTVGANVFPQSMEFVVAKLLRKNPVERYQTLLELRGDLEKVLGGEAVQPFYLSRTRRGQSQPETEQSAQIDGQTDGQTGGEGAGIGSVAIMRSAMAALILATAVLLATFFWPHTQPKKNSKLASLSSGPVGSDFLPAPLSSSVQAPASVKDTTPYSTIVQENGRKWRLFRFPKDTSIGNISRPGKFYKCQGDLRLPYDQLIDLIPSQVAFQYPIYLKRFRSGEIDSLSMPDFAFYGTTSSDNILAAATVLAGVRMLNLSTCEDLTSKCLPSLEKFTSLQELVLGKCDMDGGEMARLPILKQLKTLKLHTRSDVTPVLSSLRGSERLLSLDMSRSQTTLDGAESIATMPRLREVILGELNPDGPDEMLKALRLLSRSKSKDLKVLWITTAASVDGINAIASMPQVTKLSLDAVIPVRASTTVELFQSLSKMPNLQVLSCKTLPINRAALEKISSFKYLQQIKFEEASSTSAAQLIQDLRRFPNLRLTKGELKGWLTIETELAHRSN